MKLATRIRKSRHDVFDTAYPRMLKMPEFSRTCRNCGHEDNCEKQKGVPVNDFPIFQAFVPPTLEISEDFIAICLNHIFNENL